MSAARPKDTTSTMLRRLMKTSDIKRFIEQNDDRLTAPSFTEYLADCCKKSGMLPDHIIKRTDIDRTYGHQLFNGTRAPSRDKVLQLAFGFGFGVEDTQRLLRAARKSELYPKLRRDAAIIFCLNRKKTVMETQDILDELGLPLLGGRKSED